MTHIRMINIRIPALVLLLAAGISQASFANGRDPFGPSCQSLVSSFTDSVRIAHRGVEPAYSVYLRIKEVGYRITLAMQFPTSQSSPVFAQVIWDNLRSAEIESYILERFQATFGAARVEAMGSFIRLDAGKKDRVAFASGVRAFEQNLRNRATSPAKIHSFISRHARTASPEIREAARMMSGLLMRNKVSVQTDIDRILSRAHLHLIRDLSERELRFFDYDLFDEVLSYEKDQAMQAIAEKARGQVPDADLDYGAIHEKIRQKLIRIARGLVQSLRQQEKPYLERVREYVRLISNAGLRIIEDKEKWPHLPFNEESLVAFYERFQDRNIEIYDAPEVYEALRELEMQSYENTQKAWKENLERDLPPGWVMPKDHPDQHFSRNDNWSAMYWNSYHLAELIRFLEKDQQDKINNEAGNDAFETGNLMYVRVSEVKPGSGGANGANFWSIDTNIATSFSDRPHRLYSGRGQNKSGFDYTVRDRDD